MDETTHIPIITDWRSPIANLYYENSGPVNNISFMAPIGERKGDLKQKRQFQISRARIKGIYDAKSGNVAADQFLLSQLNERIGKKLQDIVSTIQQQQNSIIREDIDKPILIQGVAGSGKTTILLHRLAYLFYTYKNKITSDNSLIIAPNQLFIDYVSDVLPDLGINKVDTQTYLFWAKKILDFDDSYIVSPKDEDLDIKQFKGSKEFLNILDLYFEEFESNLLDNMPYSRKDIVINRYYDLKKNSLNMDMPERLELSLDYAFAQKRFRNSLNGYIGDIKDNDYEIKSKIMSYFNKATNVYKIYKNMYKEDSKIINISKYSLEGLETKGKLKYFRIEDLAPMVYLYEKIYDTKHLQKDYIMIDEAQDISFIQLATLIKLAKNDNLTIAGDIAQSIIPPFYIRDWNDVISLIKEYTEKDTSYYQLQRCYRTTVEIIDYANKLFGDKFPTNYQLPEAVLRHGQDVKTVLIKDSIVDSNIDKLIEIINNQFTDGAVTCAVLCRDKNHAIEVYDKFKQYEKDINREIVNYTSNDYSQGLLVMPIENAKGLEFDTVIIADMNNELYPEDDLSWRLLYVGITRALHKLYIVKKAL
ncbi:MAG: 3'-5' exonuclease [Candidatus Dojkabacteria bacterium]|nr:3'-5' exonuclease [Candidatus Dojkabacteria bacterium]